MGFQNIQSALGEGFCRSRPIGRRNLPRRIAQDRTGCHAHLHPKRVLALRRARGVYHRGLAYHQNRLIRQKPRFRLRIGFRHLIQAGRDMHIGKAAQVLRAPSGQV